MLWLIQYHEKHSKYKDSIYKFVISEYQTKLGYEFVMIIIEFLILFEKE